MTSKNKIYRKIYAIPDIHGRHDLLVAAITKLKDDDYDSSQDLIVFLGDFIDRGPDSKLVVETIKNLVEAGTALAVSGNHETFAIDYYAGKPDTLYIWEINGGFSTKRSYGEQMTEEHIKFLGSLPRKLEIQGFFFSHAPVPREANRKVTQISYSLDELTWTYIGYGLENERELMEKHEGPLSESGEHLIGVCGHIHRGPTVKEIREYPKYRMLDCGCGCFKEGRLAVHECVSKKTFYVES